MRRPGGALGAIIRQEILFNLKRSAPWLLLLLFSGNAVLWTLAGPAQYSKWSINSDYFIARLCVGFDFLTVPFFVAVLMADPVVRDYRLGVAPLLLSRPVGRAEYLLGKFFGNFLVLAACCSAFILTAFLLQWSGVEGLRVLPWRAAPYAKHFLLLVVVPVLALSALCFAVGTLTRSVKLVYGLVASVYVLYAAAMLTLKELSPYLFRVLDPLLMNAAAEMAKGRRAAALNQLSFSYTGALLANRAFVLAFAALCLTVLYLRFSRAEGGSASGVKGPVTLGLSESAERLSAEAARESAVGMVYAREVRAGTDAAPLPAVAVSAGGLGTRLSQLAAAVGVEFRLLRSERSLIVMAPLTMFLCSLELESFGTAFGAPFFPISSVYAANSVNALLILLGGLAVFYTGEVMHRDRELGVEPTLWSTSAPAWVLLLSKFAAVFLLACALVLLVGLTAVGLQLYRGSSAPELYPYLIIYAVVLLPSLAFMVAAAVLLNVALRDKHLAHAAGAALGVGSFYLLSRGHANWLYNPVLYRLWSYSDMTGLGPEPAGILLHRLYWLSITAACLALALLLYRRTTARGGAALALAAATVAALASGLFIKREMDRGPESERLERALIRYEERFASSFRGAPQPEWARADLRVELFPGEHRLHARGRFTLLNQSRTEISTVLVSLDPACDWHAVSLEGSTTAPLVEESARVYTLDSPLAPGATTVLQAEWDVTIPRGISRGPRPHTNFIHEGGTLLGGPSASDWLPRAGYLRKWEVADEETRRRHRAPPREAFGDSPGSPRPQPGGFPAPPFDLRVEINVPAADTAVSAGRLVEVREEGARRTFVYESERPVNGFPLVSAPYSVKRRGRSAVYYHPRHAFNVEALLDAMEAARSKFERDYGPLDPGELSLAEFPRLAHFAVSYPTLIPCSESIVFLTRADAEHVDANYFAAAHEVAHQWFGGAVVAEHAPGGGVLLEGLAEYATGALIEQELGPRAAARFRRFEEATYLRQRDADSEAPLARVDGDHPSDGVLVYQKAGLVFHMLERMLGREKMNAALREYVSRFGRGDERPTIEDLLAIFRRQTPDNSLEWFYDQWFARVTTPDFQITSASVRRDGADYVVEFTAENLGDGAMPLTVEATGDAPAHRPAPASTARVFIKQGEQTRALIRCPFKPTRLVIDPDADVLDADRLNNELTF
ncbi:MAG TPA: M1 family aminopeptidase [Pyrinomonadaceae bacterium]|nr:M1 family aminopeptidase [Pyrinomonadaceae bacterium]